MSRGMINNYSLIVINIMVISIIRLTMMCHCNSCSLSDNVGGYHARDRMVHCSYKELPFTTTMYLCIQCLSPLMLWVWISIRARCTTLCDKVCQWLATGWWFSPNPPVSSTNKSDRHDIAEILFENGVKHHQANKQTDNVVSLQLLLIIINKNYIWNNEKKELYLILLLMLKIE